MCRVIIVLVAVSVVGFRTAPVAASGSVAAEVLPKAFADPVPGATMETAYWEAFDDPVLNELVERGISGNLDLKATRERIVKAEALARQARAPLFPSVSAEAGYTLRPYDTVGQGVSIPSIPGMDRGGDDPSVVHSLSATLKASYLIDITGRNTLNRRAALGDVTAGRLDAASQASALISAIVNAYFDACQAKVQVALVEEQIVTSEAFLELVEAQFNVGSSTAVDVLQQRQQVDSAQARLPLVKMIADTSVQQLAVLIGEGNTSNLPEIPAKRPPLGPLPPTGTPERLLMARPELRAQSTRVETLILREKSAFRTLLPSLSLAGQVGYVMNYSEEADHGETWSLSALLSVPIYQGGSNYAALDSARAATRIEVFSLQQAAVKAVGEVETALTMARRRIENLEAINRQLAAAETTFEEARKRYTVGLSNYLTVLTTLATYQQIQLSKVQAELDLLSARISLMNALGGEWTKKLLLK